MKKKRTSLGSALIMILGSSITCFILTVAATIATGEWLYLVAGALFVISGGAGIWVVRTLQKKIDGV